MAQSIEDTAKSVTNSFTGSVRSAANLEARNLFSLVGIGRPVDSEVTEFLSVFDSSLVVSYCLMQTLGDWSDADVCTFDDGALLDREMHAKFYMNQVAMRGSAFVWAPEESDWHVFIGPREQMNAATEVYERCRTEILEAWRQDGWSQGMRDYLADAVRRYDRFQPHGSIDLSEPSRA